MFSDQFRFVFFNRPGIPEPEYVPVNLYLTVGQATEEREGVLMLME
jgi:hypothetical protein